MIAPACGFLALCLYFFPLHFVDRDADVEGPQIVQGLDAITTTENPYFVTVEDGSVSAAGSGNGGVKFWSGPATGDSV